MNFFQRISNVLKANLNDLVARAEDPEKVLNQAIEDMKKQLHEAKSRVAIAIADEKRLLQQKKAEAGKAEDWEKKAMAAVRGSRDDLAVQALAKKKEHEAAALQFEQQHNEQLKAVDELKKALQALTAKIGEAQTRRNVLVARVKRAEAQKSIADTLAAAGDRSAFNTFERMAEKVDRIEAEASAGLEMAQLSAGSHDDQLAEKIRLLEAAPVDDELAALKAKMGVALPPPASANMPALGPGPTPSDAKPTGPAEQE